MHREFVEHKIDVSVSKANYAGNETGCPMRAEFSTVKYNNMA